LGDLHVFSTALPSSSASTEYFFEEVLEAGSDLLPRFKEEKGLLLHSIMFSLGVAIMYIVPYLKQLM
jgi:hypothetical protein